MAALREGGLKGEERRGEGGRGEELSSRDLRLLWGYTEE